jgi:hypothetical protein
MTVTAFSINNRQAVNVDDIALRVVSASLPAAGPSNPPTNAERAANQAGTPEGYTQAFVWRTGVGLYSIQLRRPARRAIVVCGITPFASGASASIVASTSSLLTIRINNQAGAAADSDFHINLRAIRSPFVTT